MCGICGFTGNDVDREPVLTNMMNRIIHRGPDGAGTFMDEEIAMGFRRLSIIDLKGGDQPMQTEDGRLVISFNGEIYNYRELREVLKIKGHKFRTNSDTEVLLHGYSEYGAKILDRLRGMYTDKRTLCRPRYVRNQAILLRGDQGQFCLRVRDQEYPGISSL